MQVCSSCHKFASVVLNQLDTVKFTTEGSITVSCKTFGEPEGLRKFDQTAVEILVADTGCGIAATRLESIFREFEHVESSEPKSNSDAGIGKLAISLYPQVNFLKHLSQGSDWL